MYISEFRKLVNERNDDVMSMLRAENVDSDYWGILCSCMDWYESSINFISGFSHRDINNEDTFMYIFYAKLSAVDNIIEATRQMQRIMGVKNRNLFMDSNTLFHSTISDILHFKQLRAVFGAHPVNLTLSNEERIRGFANWPSKTHGEKEISVRIYRSDRKKDIQIALSFDDFTNILVNANCELNEILTQIYRKVDKHIEVNDRNQT